MQTKKKGGCKVGPMYLKVILTFWSLFINFFDNINLAYPPSLYSMRVTMNCCSLRNILLFFATVYTSTFKKKRYFSAVFHLSVPIECIHIEIQNKDVTGARTQLVFAVHFKNSINRHLRCSFVTNVRRIPNCGENDGPPQSRYH